MDVGNGIDKKLDIQPHSMAAHVHFKCLDCSMEVGEKYDQKTRQPAPWGCCICTL